MRQRRLGLTQSRAIRSLREMCCASSARFILLMSPALSFALVAVTVVPALGACVAMAGSTRVLSMMPAASACFTVIPAGATPAFFSAGNFTLLRYTKPASP